VELFSGTGTIAETFRRRGHDVLTIDADPEHEADRHLDVLDMTTLDITSEFGIPEVIWASPPCQRFSVAQIGNNWTKRGYRLHPKNEESQRAIDIVKKTLHLIDCFEGVIYFIENPRGILRKMPVMRGRPRKTITYCQYQTDVPPERRQQKPTDIWTNCTPWRPRPACRKNARCHERAPRGSKKGVQGQCDAVERGQIPAELCEDIVTACETPPGKEWFKPEDRPVTIRPSSRKRRALLVEPAYTRKYPNLALCKISSQLKARGFEVEYQHTDGQPTLESFGVKYDQVHVTTLFTYESAMTFKTIKALRRWHPDADIRVGGILASLLPEKLKEETGIEPFTGYSKELDQLAPDYDLIHTGDDWDKYSYVFTTRGCSNRCAFCAVPRIEPEYWINPSWKDAVSPHRPKVMVSDNNLTIAPFEHFEEVMTYLAERQLGVVIDNGLDCRLLEERHAQLLKDVKLESSGLRLAFDHPNLTEDITRAVHYITEAGIPKSKIMVYVLFNFKDKPREAEARMRTLVDLGVRVYPQQYVPLDQLERHPRFIGKHWTQQLAHKFRMFYLLMGEYKKMDFPQHLLNSYPHLTKDWERGG